MGGGGGVILGEVKARPKDIISFSLDYISKSKVQTSNPSSSPISLDTPARPADSMTPEKLEFRVVFFFKCTDLGQDIETNARHCPSNPVEGLVIEEKFGRIPTLNVKPVFFSHSAT